jgi:hypothetical protein
MEKAEIITQTGNKTKKKKKLQLVDNLRRRVHSGWRRRKLKDSWPETVPEVGDLAGGEVVGEGCRKRRRRWCCSGAHKLCGKGL